MNILRVTMDREGNTVSRTETFGFRERTLFRATKRGYVKAVKVLLALGANPSAYEDAAARAVVLYNQPEILKILLKDRRIDLNRITQYVMKWGIREGNSYIIDVALAANHWTSNNPIKYALALGKEDIVNKLLKNERIIDGLMEDEEISRRMTV